MLEMLEQLKLTVCSFGKDRGAEWLHDFLDGHVLSRELVLGGTVRLCELHP
jgi:hypothetical protein